MLKELPYKKIVLNASIAFMTYASWTYMVNDIGALLSALTQGSMSFTITFFLATFLEIIYRKAETLIDLLVYIILLISCIVGIQALIHLLIHTENIGMTILPGTVFGSLYSLAYVCHLRKFSSILKVIR